MFVHGFKVKTRIWHDSIHAICIDFANEVRASGGDTQNCPWKIAASPAVTAQDAPKESAIVEYAADGSISLPQLKTVFGMELGSTVTLMHPVKSGGAPFIYQIGKIDVQLLVSSERMKTLA